MFRKMQKIQCILFGIRTIRSLRIWELFYEKLIAVDTEQKAGILDICYPEVKACLINIYANAVKATGRLFVEIVLSYQTGINKESSEHQLEMAGAFFWCFLTVRTLTNSFASDKIEKGKSICL